MKHLSTSLVLIGRLLANLSVTSAYSSDRFEIKPADPLDRVYMIKPTQHGTYLIGSCLPEGRGNCQPLEGRWEYSREELKKFAEDQSSALGAVARNFFKEIYYGGVCAAVVFIVGTYFTGPVAAILLGGIGGTGIGISETVSENNEKNRIKSAAGEIARDAYTLDPATLQMIGKLLNKENQAHVANQRIYSSKLRADFEQGLSFQPEKTATTLSAK